MSFSRRIGRRAFDQEAGALIAVGDDAFADQDAFAGLEFDLERHDDLRAARCAMVPDCG